MDEHIQDVDEIVEEVVEPDGEVYAMVDEHGQAVYVADEEELEDVNVEELEGYLVDEDGNYITEDDPRVVHQLELDHQQIPLIQQHGSYVQQRQQFGAPRRVVHMGTPQPQLHHHATGPSSSSAANQIRQQLTRSGTGEAGHVYAIRGNQVFRVDKATGHASAVKSPFKVLGQSMITQRSIESKPYAGALNLMDVKPPIQQFAGQVPPSGFRLNASRTPLAFRRDSFGAPSNNSRSSKRGKSTVGHRKPCNCTKSMCLKLYCDCFANGEFCRDCNCKDCHNNLDFEAERSRAIKASLERNPNAFKPKIGVATKGRVDVERLHQKGCHCKKSNCLKNYCECYEAKVPCTERCKCSGCRNTENDRSAKFRDRLGPSSALLSLANAATLPASVTASFRSSHNGSPVVNASGGNAYSDDESEEGDVDKNDPKALPWFYMTDEVVEAATLCLVAQCEELESKGGVADEIMERSVLEEFARCLEQIIENASSPPVAQRHQTQQPQQVTTRAL